MIISANQSSICLKFATFLNGFYFYFILFSIHGVEHSDVPGVVQLSKGPKRKFLLFSFLKALGLNTSDGYMILSFQTTFSGIEGLCFKSRSCRYKYLNIYTNSGFIRKLLTPLVTQEISRCAC